MKDRKIFDNNETIIEIFIYLLACIVIVLSILLKRPLLADVIVTPIFLLLTISFIRCKERIPRVLLTLIVFQNLVIGVISHLLNYSSSDISYLTQIPFVYLCVSFFICCIWRIQKEGGIHLEVEDISFIVLLLLLTVQFFFSDGLLPAKIMGIRNYCTFYLAFILGRKCLGCESKLISYIRYFVWICVAVVAVGFVMYSMRFEQWESIGIREVYNAKKDVIVGNELPERFVTDFLGYVVKRMGSVYYEPVNLAYLLSAGLVVALFSPWTRSIIIRVFTSGCLAVGLFFTFGKGGMMIAGIVIILFFIFSFLGKFYRGEERRVKNCLFFLLILFICFAGIYYVNHYNASTNPHFVGIVSTWKSVLNNPFGYGLGNGGNANLMFGGGDGDSYWEVYSSWLATGGETALMAFIYQMGFHALFFLFMCFHGMTTRVYKGKGVYSFRNIVMFFPYILIGISIYQENTFTPQCIVPFMLIVGGMAGIENARDIKYNSIKSKMMNGEKSDE